MKTVLNTDGSDKVINTDSTDNNSASVTLPSMFNRLKEQTTTHPSAQSVPETPSVGDSANVQGSECGPNKNKNSHFL